MNLNSQQEWQGFFGEVLVELVTAGGATAFSAESNRPLTVAEIAEVCRTGRSIRVSILPADIVQVLAEMRKYVKLFRRDIISMDEFTVMLKRAWDRLDGMALDWLDQMYDQLIVLHELARGTDEAWQAVAIADEYEKPLQRIDALLAAPYTDEL